MSLLYSHSDFGRWSDTFLVFFLVVVAISLIAIVGNRIQAEEDSQRHSQVVLVSEPSLNTVAVVLASSYSANSDEDEDEENDTDPDFLPATVSEHADVARSGTTWKSTSRISNKNNNSSSINRNKNIVRATTTTTHPTTTTTKAQGAILKVKFEDSVGRHYCELTSPPVERPLIDTSTSSAAAASSSTVGLLGQSNIRDGDGGRCRPSSVAFLEIGASRSS